MNYRHTQAGWLHLLVATAGVALLVAAWLSRDLPVVPVGLAVFAAAIVVLSLAFREMTVSDEHDHLLIRYGPLPLFWRRLPYADISRVERGRTSLIDGWGIHYVPFRGWTYNLSGFDCVRVWCSGRQIQIGTDDGENLLELLRSKTGNVAAG